MKNLKVINLSNQYDRLIHAIDRYENEIIIPTISDISNRFYLQIGYILGLLICSILINIKPDITSVFGTIGLNGLGFSANWERLTKSVRSYQNDRRTLINSVVLLRIELDLCDNNDSTCLNGVETLLKKYQAAHGS